MVNQADSINGDLQFVASAIEDKQMSESDIVKMLIDKVCKLFGNCIALKEAEHLGGSINEVLHEGLV